jgi:hypothetical protein
MMDSFANKAKIMGYPAGQKSSLDSVEKNPSLRIPSTPAN